MLFALGSASLLTLGGGFLYLNLNGELEHAVNDGLRARARELAAGLSAGGRRLPKADVFAQLVTPEGVVIDATGGAPGGAPARRPVVDADELRAATAGEVRADRALPGLPQGRVLARLARRGSDPLVVVVGTSTRTVERGRRGLALALAVASPVLVAALAGGGWLVAGAALRPVEQLSDQAERLSIAEPGRRLPLLPGDDEIARLGHTLNAMLDRIAEAFAHEQAFVDDASHELRTPVSILRAELELAVQALDDPAEVERCVRSALEEAERLGHLADDLLVLARQPAGRLPIRPEQVDLDALARSIAGRLAATGGPPIDVTGAPGPVAADRARVEQLLVNLLTNARRHARSTVRVELASADTPSITVADDGPGFPLELLPRAFDRFARAGTERGRLAGGAGLGLSIVAAIARAHGWSAEAGNGGPLGGAWVRITMDGGPGRPRG